MNIVTVTLREQQISPRKARLVLNLVKKMPVGKAGDVLKFQNKKAADLTLRLLKSAIAAAKQKDYSTDQLVISEAICQEGRRLKRYYIRARGRTTPFQKRMSHLKISLAKQTPILTPKTDSPKIKGKKDGSKS